MIIGLVGPTCVGKTGLSISLAKAISAEIVSVDSRQIYREITIGTAKPTPEELAQARHHFIDERSINEPITAAEFAESARNRIKQIQQREANVLLVGGSTLYLHALLFGMDDVPASDPDIRSRLETRLRNEGLASLVDELARVDPATHSYIDLANSRRVLRALEVFQSTGQPLSAFHSKCEALAQILPARVFVLNRPRSDLYRRIDARVVLMVKNGLVDEVKALLEDGFNPNLQALQTIGYREAVEFLDSAIDLDEMVRLIQRNTRRYAKRQLTWFRRYAGFDWVEAHDGDGKEQLASRILGLVAGTATRG